ncbi:MAG: HAMP domain-containing protein, partial [Patescibacteria group bacterium]|nr:HAMP domain-containing protein [Patescibacteria group bacterium]
MKIKSNSLVFKIIFFGVILVFISLLTFSSIFLINQHKKISEQIVEKGVIFAQFSAKSIYDDYVNFYTQSSEKGFSIFKERTENKLQRNKDIVDLSLISREGRILFNIKDLENNQYYSGNVRNISDPDTLNMLKSSEIDYREIEYEGERAIEIVMPIEELSGDHVFSINYIVSFESFRDQMFIIYRDIGISFLIVFILVTLISIPFYSSITKPIKKLSNLTKKIKEGDLGVKAEFEKSSSDEIGVLAENFNVMVDDLRESRERGVEEKKQLEEDLKNKVKEIQEEKEKIKDENNEIENKLV